MFKDKQFVQHPTRVNLTSCKYSQSHQIGDCVKKTRNISRKHTYNKSFFSNKRGIELSINFIVMLILAIAVFSGGLLFINKFFNQAQEIRLRMDSQTDKQIASLLDDGSPFVVPIRTKEVQNGKFTTIGFGIYNNGANNANTHFVPTISLDSAYTRQGTVISTSDPSLLPSIKNPGGSTGYEIPLNEQQSFLIGFNVPQKAVSGNYIYFLELENPWGITPGYEKLQIVLKVR